jgi:hypothetical protein
LTDQIALHKPKNQKYRHDRHGMTRPSRSCVGDGTFGAVDPGGDMAAPQPVSGPARRAPSTRKSRRRIALAAITLLGVVWVGSGVSLSADHPKAKRRDPYRASTSRAARLNAIQAIPVEKLDAPSRAKVASVLSNISIFRRMPIGVVACDPDLYLFMVQQPDVVINIWEVMKISRMRMRQVGPDVYHVTDSAGTAATVEYLYRSHDTHLVYAEGTYEGPLTTRPVKGRCLMVLRTGYVRETDGRYYVTSRLDAFLSVERGGVELLTKTLHPLIGYVADNNFLQSVAFLGSLSRTAELNARGVGRLATKLAHVQPELRHRLAELAAEVARKSAASSAAKTANPPRVAVRTGAKPKR